jgi:hypothetical protein
MGRDILAAYPFRYHFFVSYTSREEEVAEVRPYVDQFIRDVEERGFTAWPFWLDRIHLRDFSGGHQELCTRLAQGIDECMCLVSFTSPLYMTSPFCEFEYEYFDRTSPPTWEFLGEVEWKPFKPDDVPRDFRRRYGWKWRHEPSANWHTQIKSAVRFLGRAYEGRVERWKMMGDSWGRNRLQERVIYDIGKLAARRR